MKLVDQPSSSLRRSAEIVKVAVPSDSCSYMLRPNQHDHVDENDRVTSDGRMDGMFLVL